MTKPDASSPRASLAQWRPSRSWLSFVALCSVLLQLCSALHFSLVSHRFNADLGSFEHEHALQAKRVVSAPTAPSEQPQLVRGSAACAPDACPVGFAGAVFAPLASADLSQLIALPLVTASALSRHVAVNRTRCLLTAPKTSPPVQA